MKDEVKLDRHFFLLLMVWQYSVKKTQTIKPERGEEQLLLPNAFRQNRFLTLFTELSLELIQWL